MTTGEPTPAQPSRVELTPEEVEAVIKAIGYRLDYTLGPHDRNRRPLRSARDKLKGSAK